MTIMLVGNKADFETKRQVSYEEAESFAKAKGLYFCEVSAKDTEGVVNVPSWLFVSEDDLYSIDATGLYNHR